MGSASAIAVSTPAEPPTTMRQNGDGTEAPAAPPKVQQPQQPIFESHSESVPVDGKPGINLKLPFFFVSIYNDYLILYRGRCRRRHHTASLFNGRLRTDSCNWTWFVRQSPDG